MEKKRDTWAKVEIIVNIIATIAIPVVIWTLGIYITNQQREADANKLRVENNATHVTNLLQHLSSQNRRERLLAAKVTEYFSQNKLLPPELKPVLLEIAKNDSDSVVASVAKKTLMTDSANGKAAHKEYAGALQNFPVRVYIQIANKSQLKTANLLQTDLRKLGMNVPGIENIENKVAPPSTAVVRFFNDADQGVADNIKNILVSYKMNSPLATQVKGLKAKQGTIEVWFSKTDP